MYIHSLSFPLSTVLHVWDIQFTINVKLTFLYIQSLKRNKCNEITAKNPTYWPVTVNGKVNDTGFVEKKPRKASIHSIS